MNFMICVMATTRTPLQSCLEQSWTDVTLVVEINPHVDTKVWTLSRHPKSSVDWTFSTTPLTYTNHPCRCIYTVS